MTTLVENLKKLYENELYTSAISLGQLILSAFERHTLLSPEENLHTLVYLGSSLYLENDFRNAEPYLKKALLIKKSLAKCPPKSPTPLSKSFIEGSTTPNPMSDIELKYKCARCLMKTNQNDDAINLIETIPIKARPAKINALYGNLTQASGYDRLAFAAYKEVVKDCPLAFDIVEQLLEMGLKGIDMNSLVVDATHWPQCAWLPNFIEAQGFMASRNYPAAIAIFKQLESNSLLENWHKIVVKIGECYYYNGDYETALMYLKRAHLMAPNSTDGLMILASLLGKKNKIQELEKMLSPDLSVTEYKAEHWYLLAQFLFHTGKSEKANYFVQKVLILSPNSATHIEATLFKAAIATKMQKYNDALADLKSILKPAAHRFELYMGLSEVYVKMHRYRDAQMCASSANQNLGKTPRTLTLIAKTCEGDVLAKKQIKSILKKALKMDEYYLPAIYMLVGIMRSEGDVQGAVQLLKKHIAFQPNCKLLTTLADILNANNDPSALEFYTMALKLDPTYRRALDGLMSLGKSNKSPQFDHSASNNSMVVEDREDYKDNNPFEVVEMGSSHTNNSITENDMWFDVEVEINNN